MRHNRVAILFFPAFITLVAACSLEKKTAVNRALQNLTAHYNIIFNANELLRQKQEIYATSFVDNYTDFLRVYQDTTGRAQGAIDKELDGVIARANTIIAVKEQSHYIGDAYLLQSKANYLYGQYFLADEFSAYVIRNYPQNVNLVQQARNWRVRSLLNLGQLPQAKLVSDTALLGLNETKKTADPGGVYAARLQYDLDAGDYKEAEEMAKKAIKDAANSRMRYRLTFILAQLQEANKKPADAYASYSKVVKSNASFEMAFNAELNRIRIEDTQNGRKLTHLQRLQGLIKNDNNADLLDQIYFQIGDQYYAENNIDAAIKNYRLALKYSTRNQNQKAITYLRLADIAFKNRGDYNGAKKLYDSTLMNMLPTYPGYRTIQLRANNLTVLGEQLGIIAREDTLQRLAKLNEKDRADLLNEYARKAVAQQKAAALAATNSAFTNANSPNSTVTTATVPGNATFYFYNVNSVSQGFTAFKRVWGNRKLEDNWRRSLRTSSDITANTQNLAAQVDPSVVVKKDERSTDDLLSSNYKKQLLQNLPLTPELLAQSNSRVYAAYFLLANFYRDVLEDPKESIASFEILLSRFPDNNDKPAIYYNLYRLYSNIDIAKSDYYKNLLLKNYPETTFAKIILDPEYSRKMNDIDAEFNTVYDQLYDLYANKKYIDVIARADALLLQYPKAKFAAQIAYLRAIAAGHNEKLTPFKADLLALIKTYPDDQLISPLVNQHLSFIAANEAELAARPVVLVDNDFTDAGFVPTSVTPTYAVVQQPVKQPVAQKATPAAEKPKVKPTEPPVQQKAPVVTTAPKTPPSIFSLRDSTHYYFVVNVASGTTNLSSSRFGFGQFNRANFDQQRGISHQLTTAGPDNQLIFVGNFNSLTEVKDYARAIIPLLPQIMKVPADKYSFFIITKENLDKLADKKLLDTYVDFYQKNY
ncbi:type IX secretion system periplasmic lipoprotein PorW/SprE [Mucilaginibacter ginkgonis]|uniref:Uncharacterized protein n=1 Tax=Mucilaginibacter ginkgonis TaxID=2682091 RepID=A0A6I4IML9_9SPHI|nr:hypothetical protein [Mucilaginibacter ginkgonis]QQL50077.1 hypothetical protein GO620_001085 [Mucilaginibacter ginkgonis]